MMTYGTPHPRTGQAVNQELSTMLLKLDPLLGGVPLTIRNVKLPGTTNMPHPAHETCSAFSYTRIIPKT
jgi:hypothetical protein